MKDMIQYRKKDDTLGQIKPEEVYDISISDGCFRITLISYGWDKDDYYFDYINDVVELKIGNDDKRSILFF
jgi:hypothetical protein